VHYLWSWDAIKVVSGARALVQSERGWPLLSLDLFLREAKLRALSAKWRDKRELVAWCEERRGYGVVLIGA
jgi:hypothetical protein